MAILELVPDAAPDLKLVDERVRYMARVYLHTIETPAMPLWMKQFPMEPYNHASEDGAAVFHEVQQRLQTALGADRLQDPRNFVAYCVLKNADFADYGPSPGISYERLASHVVVRASETQSVSIAGQPSRGKHIRGRGYSIAETAHGKLLTHNLIHLPISEREALAAPIVYQAIKPHSRVPGYMQPYVAEHIRMDSGEALEQKIIVDELL